jgi:hypothetical protein
MVQPPCAGDGRQSRCRNRLIYVWLPRPTNGTGGLELSVHSPQRALPTACIPHSMHSRQRAFPTACIPYSACTHFPPCILLPSLHTLTSQPPQPLRPFRRPPQALAVCGHRYVVTARGTQRERKRRRPDKRGAVRSRSDEQQSAAARQRDRDVRRQRHLLGAPAQVRGRQPLVASV